MNSRHRSDWLAWITFAISLIALVFALLAYINSQAANQPAEQSIEHLRDDLESGLESLQQQGDQVNSAQFDRQVNALRTELRAEYQDARVEVQRNWQTADARLEKLQSDAQVNLSQALEEIQEWLEELQSDLES